MSPLDRGYRGERGHEKVDQSDQRQSASDSDRMYPCKSGGCLLAMLLICLPSLLSSQEQEEEEEQEGECEGSLDCSSQLLPGQYLCLNR